jgi:tetratricopeptide (TPR) repeat protein
MMTLFPDIYTRTCRMIVTTVMFASAQLLSLHATAAEQRVKDLKYGVVLFEFYQQKYFDTLVEFEYASEKGGILNHGSYPDVLKGGVSLSYGLDEQANDIFASVLAMNTIPEIQNRAWYYLAKMLYLRGDIQQSATTLSNIHGTMPGDINQEYRYLAALINIRLGYYEEARIISANFDKDSRYAPYLYFNLGVTLGKQKDYATAIEILNKAAAFSDTDENLRRLADRSHMAIAHLYDEEGKEYSVLEHISHVSTTGVYSNRALLGAGWLAVNSGDYQKALIPLNVLQSRSMAIPEVQEAVLLTPHVYEKLGLPGRAADGFISAYARYSSALDTLESARETLLDANVLELFVRNIDEMLVDNDWFGTAPSVSLNPLSPFLFELMSDHSFQSVLKDLRDLYAIRNNLEYWKQKRVDFEVMLEAHSRTINNGVRDKRIATALHRQSTLQQHYTELQHKAALIDSYEQGRLEWLLTDVQFELDRARMMTLQLESSSGMTSSPEDSALAVEHAMTRLDKELKNTNMLIGKVEKVMFELINAELGVHEKRLKYYRVQSHLAKARILDRSLADLEVSTDDQLTDGQENQQEVVQPDTGNPVATGGDDAA